MLPTVNQFGRIYIYIIIIICYIYIALFLRPQSALHRWGNLLNHHQCAASTWMMRRQPYCARTPTTHQLTGGEETVMKPISIWGWLGGHDGQRPRGKFGQDAGVTPLLFFEGHPGIFNDHRESGPRFNVSSEGRCSFGSIVSPSLYWGIRTHTDHRVSTPCWPH